MLKAVGIIALIAAISFTVSCGGGGGSGGGPTIVPPGGGSGDPETGGPESPGGEPESEPASMIEMVPIPAGSFWMGSPGTEPNRNSNETQHEVTLTEGFYMGKYPVTQKQWEEVMGADARLDEVRGSAYGVGDDYPMYYVNWYDALVFCNKLSVMEDLTPAYSIEGEADTDKWIDNYGAIPSSWMALSKWNKVEIVPDSDGYRLPTEAQWEYACRGDYANKDTEQNTKPFGIGDGTKITGDMANFDGRTPYDINHVPEGEYYDSLGTPSTGTTQVGYYGSANANSYGLYDMHGNVREWCWDWNGVYLGTPETDPVGAAAGSIRINRGGNWSTSGGILRSVFRNGNDPGDRGATLGFRLVRP